MISPRARNRSHPNVYVWVITGLLLLVSPISVRAQLLRPATASALPDAPLPDAPLPRPHTTSGPRQSSGAGTGAQQSLRWKGQAVYGIRPVFTATGNWNAPPLTFHQKSYLFLHQITGPWIGVISFTGAGFGQIDHDPAYGEGAQGYFKRVASNYADQVDGDFWHNLVLPQLLHEDPRYFRKGSGPVLHRFLWAASAPVWARRDNKTWGINYSHILGNLIGSAIANVYYAPSNRTAGQTVGRAFTGLAESTIASELAEFWPNIACRIQLGKAARVRCRKQNRQRQEARRHP